MTAGPSLASLLAQHMAEHGLNQAQLAERAHVPKATLHRWLTGKSVSPYHRGGLLGVAAALGLSRLETNRLLRTAGFPSLDALAAAADPEERALLARWSAPVSHNLPADLTSFVGRAEEVVEAAQLLCRPGVRLLTLTGPGGSGKTRLALRVACETLDVFPGGIYFVPLAAVADPILVVSSIAERLGLREVLDSSLPARLAGWLRGRRVLLVLDNLEHLLASGPRIAELLQAAPGLTVLATSRVPLHLSGEHEWPVLPFPLPAPDQPRAKLRMNEAVQLFLQRAEAANPRRRLDDDDLPAVVEICRRLDGLPLAIELAAAGTRQREPWRLLADFPSWLDLAAGGPIDLPERQRTLRGAIAWSMQLLPPPARRFLERLAVFAGSWSAADAAAVCAPDTPAETVDGLLRTLLDANLIQPSAAFNDTPRYQLLETIREDALERLTATGEADALRERHARHYLALAESAPPYVPEARPGDWFERIDADLDNLRAALDWSATRAYSELLVRLTAALWPYWHEYLRTGEGLRWLDATLPRLGPLPAALRASVLTGAGILTLSRTGYRASREYLEAALTLWQQFGDRHGQAVVLQQLGWCAYMTGDLKRALTCYEEELQAWREVGDERGIASALCDLGLAAFTGGDFAAAGPYLEEAEALFRTMQDEPVLARMLRDRGMYALLQGDVEEAIPPLREAVDHLRRVPQSHIGPTTNFYLGTALCFAGQLDEARACYVESLRYNYENDDQFGLSLSLLGFAALAHREGDGHRAATLCGAALALQHATGTTLAPTVRALYEREVGLVINLIGPEAFEECFARGSEMTGDAPIALAREAATPL